ncbi:MAG: hypothetical protein PVSMB8_02610 [Vulcanimicrobiaceae bacterium]
MTPQEAKTVIEAGIAGTFVEYDATQHLRISNTANGATGSITVGAATTALGLGFAVGQTSSATGWATTTSTAGTYPTLFAGGETLTLGFDDAANFTVTFAAGDQTEVQVLAKINAAAANAGFPQDSIHTFADAATVTRIRFTGAKQGGQIRIVGASAAGVLTTLGLVTGTKLGVAQTNGLIPAGTIVQVSGSTRYVIMQDVAVTADPVPSVTASGAGPYPVKIRHAIDDTTGTSNIAGSITVIPTPIALASFACINLLPTTAALTEAQIDVAYTTALASTIDLSSVAKEANIIWSARQSNVVRRALRQNAIDASAKGCFGRITAVRPALNTARDTARSTVAEPGVGAYRDRRVIYCWPQANTFVPQIAARGTAGGFGFTADGNIDVGADGFLCSVMSQLPPEENPGQETAFTGAINSVEKGANAQGLNIDDYKLIKAAGICGLRIDGVGIFQSGVTSVDPLLNPSLTDIQRQRMADFLTDSLARFSKKYGKKLMSDDNKTGLETAYNSFFGQMLPAVGKQRIAKFRVDAKTGNTPATTGKGLFRIRVFVRTLQSFLSIVIESVIGPNVNTTTEVQAAA